MDKGDIIKIFPNLKDDTAFLQDKMSPEDPNYNCIAYAYQMDSKRWMQPPCGNPILDAVTWWPPHVQEGMGIDCLVEAFAKKGYEICDSWEHEDGYIKVALYYNPNNNHWTHAARESRVGRFWMSKLGPSHDIHHISPYTIEGKAYGEVYCIMKMKE